MKSERTKQCDISRKVKMEVWERDEGQCILCGTRWNTMPNAHYIPRHRGGLGIAENVVTLCFDCHFATDHSTKREGNLEKIKTYLDKYYPDFEDEERVYDRLREVRNVGNDR